MGIRTRGVSMKKVEIALAVLVLVVLGAIGWDRIVDPLLHRETYRGEVRTLYENLHLGMTKEQVRRETESGRYPHLDFHREGQLWLGSAPLEFGAGNWVLAIGFRAITCSASAFAKAMAFKTFTIPSRRRRTRWRRGSPILIQREESLE